MSNPLFETANGRSLASPRAIANLAARTARPGTQPQDNRLSDPYQAPETQEAQEQPQQPEQPGLGARIGGAALNTVAAVGNLLDLPGSSVRDVMTGRNPLDQWLDPFGRQADTNRISGRDMLREKGLVGKEDNWKNFIGGMALEIATDPTTYLGVGALSRAGKAFSSIGVNAKKLRPLAKEMAETGSKNMGPKASTWIGGKLASFAATPKMIFDHAENLLTKNVKPVIDNSVEGTFKATSEGSSAFASKADLEKVVVPPEKAAWAMVDNGRRIEVYKNAKESSEWVLDAEATRVANMRLADTVMGATPRQLKNQWMSAHKTNYGKNLGPEAYAKLVDEDMEKPLRSLVSVGMPFMHPMKEWNATSNPEQTWTEWLKKQPELQQANDLKGGPPPLDASSAAVGPNAPKPKPSPKAAPVQDAATEATVAAAQEEAAQRSKVPPQQGRDLLKQLGRTDIDAIQDDEIAKEISRYGLLKPNGELRTSTLGANATRALHQAARTFGPNGVDAFPVVETLAKTWGKLNGVDPDEYFKALSVQLGDLPDGKLGKYVGDPSEIVTQDGVQKIMRMGERVITAMKGADGQAPSVATFMHEIGHDARAMFDSTMQKKMEDAVGAYIKDNNLNIRLLGEDGRWTSEAEEIFANGFEAYLATGKAPLKGLAGAFEKLKGFIQDLWRTISGNPKLESYVHPQLKETFDAMLSPGKAKAPKAVAPPATAVSQAADAVDGQADEAVGTKPLQPDENGGESAQIGAQSAEQVADTVQTPPAEPPTTKPNVSEAPTEQADISGQNPDRSGQAKKIDDLNKQIAEENEVLKYDDSRNPAKYNRLNRLIQLRSELEDQMQKAQPPQQNPLVQQAAQAPQPKAAMNNPIQEAAKEPVKEIPYSKDPARNKELNRIHQSLAKTVGDDAAKAITPLVQEFVEAGNNANVLNTTIESMSPEEMAGLAAKIAADPNGAANELLQATSKNATDNLYYKTERMLDDGKVGGKTSYDQFKATAKKYGVKDEELEDLNMDELFKDGKPKTPQEIRDWIDSNRVELKDITSGKYEGYQVPGGDTGTYRELLIAAPSKIDADNWIETPGSRVVAKTRDNTTSIIRQLDDSFTVRVFGEDMPERYATIDEAKRASGAKATTKDGYIGPHFEEPNVIAHVRADDVTLPNGKKAMRVQEVQSDWHQAGKKRGYKSEGFRPKWDDYGDGTQEWMFDAPNGDTARARVSEVNGKFRVSIDDDDLGYRFDTIEEAKEQAIESMADYTGYIPRESAGIPDGPFKKSWPELALKKILLEAAQKGYDEVHIVKGSDAAQAVGGPNAALSTFYDQILHGDMKKLTKKWGSFQGIGNNAKANSHYKPWKAPSQGYNRWLLESTGSNPFAATIDKTTDGRWLANFHIEDVGSDVIGTYKSLDEAKSAAQKYFDEEIARHGIDQHGFSGDIQVFSITPKMRQELLDQGLPLYQKGKDAAKGAVTFKETGEAAIKIVTGQGDASTAVHELAHVFRRNLKEELQSRAESALEQQLKDTDTIKNILGGKSDAVLKDANGNWTREAEEVWARLFEKHVREGKAPTSALKEAFEALKKMMINVYKTLTKNPEINGKINPELRAVFDEMLGGAKKAAPGPKVSRVDPIIAAATGAKQAPPASVNPLVPPTDIAVAKAPEVPMRRELPTSPDEIAKTTAPNPIETAIPKAQERAAAPIPNGIYDTAKVTPRPRVSGLMARAKAVDKDAAKQGAFVPSDELVQAAKEAPAPKATTQFTPAKDDVLPHVADAESVLGLGKDGKRLSELDDLPDDKKQVFEELLSDLNGFGEGEREAAMELVTERLSRAIGREATPDEVQKIANWLDRTNDQFKRSMQRVDKEYVYTPDKLSAKTKGDIGEKLRTLSKKGMGESLTPDEIQPLVDQLGLTPSLFVEGADLSEDGIKYAIKSATGTEISERQAKAASIFMNSDQGSAAKLREAAAKQQRAESVFDVDVGGAPKKIREPFVGGKALEEMPLEESVGKITQAELAKAMPTATDDEIQAMAQKLSADSGVAVEAKGDVAFDPNMTAAKVKERAQEEVKELRKQLKKTTSKNEKRAIENRIEEIKDAAKQGKKAAQDGDVQNMYRRMNALKMLASKAKDAATKDAYMKLANEVRGEIAKEELGRAYRAAEGLAKGVDAFRMENQSAINEGMLKLIDQHDYTKLPRIQSKSFWNTILNEIKPSSVDEMTKRVGDIKNADKAANFEANLLGKKSTEPAADKILEVLNDDSVREKMSPFQQEIVDQARKGASPAEAAEALKMSEEKYISSLKEVMDKVTEVASSRIVQFKDATPAEAAKKVITHKIAEARWSEILDLVKGSTAKQTLLQALDVGDSLFMASAPVRMMVRLFDPAVMGAGTLEEQEIARMASRAQERAVYAFREILHPIVHYSGRQEFFDHKKIATKLIQEQKMERVAALKEAQKIIIDRDNEIRRFFEDKGKAKLDHAKFGISEQEAEDFGNWLESVKKLLPEDILNKRAAGLSDKELADKTTAYAPRRAVTPGRSVLKSEKNQALLDASVDSQISREEHLKNLPGGTPILNAMSLDEAISGIGHDEAILGKGLSQATMDKAVSHILKNYKDELLTDDLMKNGVPTEEGMEKIRKIASSIASLPKDHLEQQVPWFGNNFMRDLALYFEQSFMKQSVSLAAQRLAAKNMITTADQKYLLSKFFEQASMDNHNAYLNVIKQTGRLGDYQRFAQDTFNDWVKSGKIVVQDDGLLKMGDKKALSPSDMAEEMMMAKMYADSKQLGVSKDTHEAAGYWLQGFARPQELTVLKQVSATMLNAFKSAVTIPFLAFHGRNKTSGFAQNVFFGAYDPTANFADRYFKTERQAFTLRTGQPIKNIHKELPKDLVDEILATKPGEKTEAAKDALITEWVRAQVFKYGLVGDRMGHSAEKIIDTTSSLTSQSPGTVIKDRKNWFGVKNALLDPTTSLKEKVNPTAFDGAPYFAIDRTGARPKVDVKTYEETTFTPGAVGTELASLVEDTNRTSPFLAYLKQGMSPEEAARRVHATQFDYSKSSDFEKVLKQFIPFYLFASRALKLTLTDLLENPGGKQAWSIRAANRAQSDAEAMPEHIRRGIAIPLGKGAEGQDRYLSGLGLAWEDSLGLLSFAHGDVKTTASSAYSKLRPEIQAVGELAFGRSAFFDREFNDLDPQLGRLRDNLLGKEQKGLAEPLAGSQSLEFLVGKSPFARVPSTLNNVFDSRKNPLEKLVGQTTGIRVSDVNQEAAERIRINQAAEQLKELGAREMTMSYIPDWKKARMTPEEIAHAEALQKMINSIKSEQRDRKKQAQVNSLRMAAQGEGVG